MFLIKFKGYKTNVPLGNFLLGKEYECKVVDGNRFYETTDDDGEIIKFCSFFNDALYDFERV